MPVVRIVQQLENAESDCSNLNTFFFFLQRKKRKGATSRRPDCFVNRERAPPWREREREIWGPRRVTKELIKCSANCPEQSESLHLPKIEPPWAFAPRPLRCSRRPHQPGLSSSGSTLGLFLSPGHWGFSRRRGLVHIQIALDHNRDYYLKYSIIYNPNITDLVLHKNIWFF